MKNKSVPPTKHSRSPLALLEVRLRSREYEEPLEGKKKTTVSTKRKTSKPAACGRCWSIDLVRRIAAYPVQLAGPLEGNQSMCTAQLCTIVRLAAISCPHPPARPKLIVNVAFGIRLFLGQLT